jgi:CrcB protein
MTLLLVLAGGAAGALLRWAAGLLIGDRALPWPTITVNIAGAFLLGLLTALPTGPALTALLGTGLCGALTTWSTLAYQSTTLPPPKALLNVVLTIIAGCTAVWLGASLG